MRLAASGCASFICVDEVCLAPICSDGVQNGDGGTDCSKCEDGQRCFAGSDCFGGSCEDFKCPSQ